MHDGTNDIIALTDILGRSDSCRLHFYKELLKNLDLSGHFVVFGLLEHHLISLRVRHHGKVSMSARADHCGITTVPPVASTFAIHWATESTLSIGMAPWIGCRPASARH
jgi:hypothetical protein